MVFFKKPYTLRRYSVPVYIRGHTSVPYQDLQFLMDVKTEEDKVIMEAESVLRLAFAGGRCGQAAESRPALVSREMVFLPEQQAE